MSYSSGTRYVHGNPALAKELSFAAPDPSMGDASISISVLSPAHSATYQCKVKKSPGVDMRKVSLVVLGKTGNWVAVWGQCVCVTCHLWQLQCFVLKRRQLLTCTSNILSNLLHWRLHFLVICQYLSHLQFTTKLISRCLLSGMPLSFKTTTTLLYDLYPLVVFKVTGVSVRARITTLSVSVVMKMLLPVRVAL